MTTTVFAPISGKAIQLGEVSDPVFSQKMLGDGIAISPMDTTVYSPIAGKISMIAETKHAIGLKNDEGVEVLIHIGIDTVNLKGEGFESFIQAEDSVEIGAPLVKFDINLLKEKRLDPTTMIIVTNSKDYQVNEENLNADVQKSTDKILTVNSL